MRDAITDKSGLTGTVLKERWVLEECVGKGGVASVFAALDRKTGERVAVKVLQPTLVRQSEIRVRFIRESQAANAVGHPAVVRIIDADQDANLTFIVMELLEGELVEDWRMRLGGTLPVSDALDVADQVLDVLAVAHEKGIVHRDVKPENLFRQHDGTIKILDFGIARVKQTAMSEMTKTGVLLGTPEFMPPEQALGKRGHVDAQSDVWAVGATLFVLISGEDVHRANNIGQVLIAAVSRPARSLVAAAPKVPTPIIEVVDKALAFEKGARWKTANEMRRALTVAAERAAIQIPKARVAIPIALGSSPVSTKRSVAPSPSASPSSSPLLVMNASSVKTRVAAAPEARASQAPTEPKQKIVIPARARRPPASSSPIISVVPDTLDEETIATARAPAPPQQRPRVSSSADLPDSMRDELENLSGTDDAPTFNDTEMKRQLEARPGSQRIEIQKPGLPPVTVDPFEVTSAAASYPLSVGNPTAKRSLLQVRHTEPVAFQSPLSQSQLAQPQLPPQGPPSSDRMPPPPTPRIPMSAPPPLNPAIMASMKATQPLSPEVLPSYFPAAHNEESARQRRFILIAALFVIFVGGLGFALILKVMLSSSHTKPAPSAQAH